MNIDCTTNSQGRRRQFWSTQPCTTVEICGRDCGKFGIKFSDASCGDDCDNTLQSGCAENKNRTIDTTNWIRGLLINIIMTDGAKPDSDCGYPAGTRGGHWSNSYRSGLSVGTNIRAIPAGKTTSQNALALQIEAQKIADKLVSYGVVKKAKATVKYLAAMTYSLTIEYETKNQEIQNVGFSGTRSGSTFVWN